VKLEIEKLRNYFYFSKQWSKKLKERKILLFNPTYSLRGSQGAWILG